MAEWPTDVAVKANWLLMGLDTVAERPIDVAIEAAGY